MRYARHLSVACNLFRLWCFILVCSFPAVRLNYKIKKRRCQLPPASVGVRGFRIVDFESRIEFTTFLSLKGGLKSTI
jgi:hypothetical protein